MKIRPVQMSTLSDITVAGKAVIQLYPCLGLISVSRGYFHGSLRPSGAVLALYLVEVNRDCLTVRDCLKNQDSPQFGVPQVGKKVRRSSISSL
jgi:hypothetical protein